MHTAPSSARRVSLALTLVAIATGCGGTAHVDGNPRSIPSVLRTRANGEEIAPFTGFSVVGVRLFTLSGAVPDSGWSYVVGVDAQERVYEGAALMARLGPLPDEVMAERAIAILLREAGRRPLLPTDPRPANLSEDLWRVVAAPHREGETLLFFFDDGEMEPSLTEVSLDTRTFAVTRRSAEDVLLSRGHTVATSIPLCHPFVRCGCYDGCRRFTNVRVPPDGALRFRLEDGETGALYAADAACSGARCAQVCRAAIATATCDPILVRLDESCDESCPPSEAPFHCETLADGCRVVPHTVRVPATP